MVYYMQCDRAFIMTVFESMIILLTFGALIVAVLSEKRK